MHAKPPLEVFLFPPLLWPRFQSVSIQKEPTEKVIYFLSTLGPFKANDLSLMQRPTSLKIKVFVSQVA